MGDVAVKARVTGRVQGVWFRGWTREQAERRGLQGWVRNESDGSVSVVLCGPEADVADLVVALHRGPQFAQVARVETEPVADWSGAGFAVVR